jgi:hypothetical protein
MMMGLTIPIQYNHVYSDYDILSIKKSIYQIISKIIHILS